MSFQIPTTEPTEVTVGDRIQWKRSLQSYPATQEGWTLTYYLRANIAMGQIDIVAVADGQDYSIDISPTITSDWVPAAYFWTAFVSKSGDRKPIGEGRMDVLQNPELIILPVDGRSHARRCLDSIELVIEGRATRDDLKYAFQAVGRSVEKIPTADLLKLRDYYATEVRNEENAGSTKGKNVFVRFTMP